MMGGEVLLGLWILRGAAQFVFPTMCMVNFESLADIVAPCVCIRICFNAMFSHPSTG